MELFGGLGSLSKKKKKSSKAADPPSVSYDHWGFQGKEEEELQLAKPTKAIVRSKKSVPWDTFKSKFYFNSAPACVAR